MKLGTQTGSVINHLHSRAVIGQPEPKPGMGCTILKWTDRDAATIFRVFQVGKATIIETRDDHTRCISGSAHDGSAKYEHKINVKGFARHFRRRDNGMWGEVIKNQASGRWILSGRNGLRIGERDTYYDPSF
jgi:hypothetical protein